MSTYAKGLIIMVVLAFAQGVVWSMLLPLGPALILSAGCGFLIGRIGAGIVDEYDKRKSSLRRYY